MLCQSQIPFILLVYDFVNEQYSISLSTIAIFFSIWTVVTFLSCYVGVSWLRRNRLLVLFLVSLAIWLACGYQAYNPPQDLFFLWRKWNGRVEVMLFWLGLRQTVSILSCIWAEIEDKLGSTKE